MNTNKQTGMEPLVEEEINLREYWYVLRRSLRAVVCTTLGVAVLSCIYSLVWMPRRWESTVRVLMPQLLQGAGVGLVTALPGAGGEGLSSLVGAGPSLAETYKVILESDALRESLADNFHLTEILKLKSKEEKVKAVSGILLTRLDPKAGLMTVTASLSHLFSGLSSHPCVPRVACAYEGKVCSVHQTVVMDEVPS